MASSERQEGWDPVPGYLETATGMYTILVQCYHTLLQTRYSVFKDFPQDVANFCQLETRDLAVLIALSVLWTVGRTFATQRVFKPLGRYFQLTSESIDKMPESAWKCLFYLSIWSYTLYVLVLSGRYRFLQKPSSVWDGWNKDALIPSDIYWIYMVELSFYFHGLYAIFYQDLWRKDSSMMLLHHVLTILLLWTSFVFRYQNIGVLIIFLHDVCDIELEFSKLNVYFKVRGKVVHNIHEHIATIGFAVFAITWFITRLYWFPLKALHTTSQVLLLQNFFPPYLLFCDSILCILFAMDLYWFILIVFFAIRVLTGDIQELDDTREYDVEEKFQKNKLHQEKKDGNQQNGCLSNDKKEM